MGTDYQFTNSWGSDRVDVDGCLVGSDGTGGVHAHDPRIRRCCFGAAVIRVVAHSFDLVGIAYGTVCGKQTVPRSEMQGLLHMLIFIRGNAVIIIDNKGVVNTFWKGKRARPKFNCILWAARFKEAKIRSELEYGYLNLSGLEVILS